MATETETATKWQGLADDEAARRLAADGPNVIEAEQKRTLPRLLWDVVKEPMFLLLLASAGLYLAFGDLKEGLTLLGFVVVVITITVVQEGRTERALDALRDLSSPRAQVLRGGLVKTVPARELVLGDVIRVAEGDRVPGDALLRAGATLTVDESLLTGESVPVSKVPDEAAARASAPGGDGTPTLFSGTLVVSGRGLAEVCGIGKSSELGRIGAGLAEVARERTPLQREVDWVVKRMALVGLGVAVSLVLMRGLMGHGWVVAALSGLTVAMALLPEEFPVVLTVFLALGAWRIAKRNVLTRRVTSVETLGSVQVLCTDKTGTLTLNRMTLRELRPAGGERLVLGDEPPSELPEAVHALVEFGILASPKDPFDPMEKAFHALGSLALGSTEHVHPTWEDAREYPLSPELLAVTHAWKADAAQPGLVVATKGAPEAVFELCHLDEATAAGWRAQVEEMAREGLRVLGVARGRGTVAQSPGQAHDVDFDLLGLVGLADPLRGDVAQAIADCRRARIRVVLITGDHPDTARAIARQAGLEVDRVLTGPELDALDDAALAAALDTTSVVARAVPAHKLRLVRALRARGQVVGMTGDGVNDAPALKAADIGIAMGQRGTDVAREASALVLVNDDFGSIVHAVRIGRRIYDNLRKAVSYIVAVHLPIAGLSLVPVLLGWGAMLGPVHVAFLQLVIDPACSIVFEMEPEEPDVMDRPPRSASARLFTLRGMVWSVLQGLVVLGAALGAVWWARGAGADEAAQRTVAFVALIAGNIGILLSCRSIERPFWVALGRWNAAVPIIVGATVAVVALVVLVPPLAGLLGFGLARPAQLGIAVALGLVPVLVLDVGKAFRGLGPKPPVAAPGQLVAGA
jgi:Ca2+-transporting ATPase